MLLASAPFAAPQADAEASPRTVVLVVPGLGGDRAERGVEEGWLPHLAALREEGGYARVRSSLPCDETTAALELHTGVGPTGHLVPGYVTIEREERGLFPNFGAIRFVDASASELELGAAVEASLKGGPATYPIARNRAAGRDFWNHAAEAGVPALVLRAGMAFDRPVAPGAEVLFGEGVLDVGTELGLWSVYTDDPVEFERPPLGRDSPTAGSVYRVDVVEGRIETELFGPRDFVTRQRQEGELERVAAELEEGLDDLERAGRLLERQRELQESIQSLRWYERCSLPLVFVPRVGAVRITIQGQSHVVAQGSWSPPFQVTFPLGEELEVHGQVRMKVLSAADPLRVYVDSIDLDPARPPAWRPLSHPPELARELAAEVGPFDTYGWGVTASMGYKDGELDEETLLEDVEATLENGVRLTRAGLQRADGGLLMAVFAEAQAAQHVLMRHEDVAHPLHDPGLARRAVRVFGREVPLAGAVDAIFVRIDELIGEVRAELRPGDTMLVCSPFGFASMRTQVDLNAWLAEQGFLVPLRGRLENAYGPSAYVDWSKTRAYAAGITGIYLNLEGREPEGIVTDEAAPEVLEELRKRLLASRDPASGAPFVLDVVPTGTRRGEPAFDRLPDLFLGFEDGYRVAWKTTGGGMTTSQASDGEWVPGPVLSDNDSLWSGVHESMSPRRIEGVLFSSRSFDVPEGGVHLQQVAPTVLATLGVEAPSEMTAPALDFDG